MIEQIKPFIPYILTYTPPIIMWIFTVYKMTKELPEVIRKLDELTETSSKNDRAILWALITYKGKQIKKQGHCDLSSMECVEELYKRYKEVGGNHGVDILVKEIRAICERSE